MMALGIVPRVDLVFQLLDLRPEHGGSLDSQLPAIRLVRPLLLYSKLIRDGIDLVVKAVALVDKLQLRAFKLFHPVEQTIELVQDLIPDRQTFPVDGFAVKTQVGDQLCGEQFVFKISCRESENLIREELKEGSASQDCPTSSPANQSRGSLEALQNVLLVRFVGLPYVSHSSVLYHTRSTSATPSREIFA